MSGPPHHFMQGLTGQQGMRSQFGGAMQNQLGAGMQNQLAGQLSGQLPVQMSPQMSNPMMSQMGAGLGGQMAPQMSNPMASQMASSMAPMNGMGAGGQMMGQLNQQYTMGAGGAMQQQQQQQPTGQMQIQPQGIGELNNAASLQHHGMQQQPQQQVMQPAQNVVPTPTPPAQSQPQQSKELNTASLCRIGQETVQDIVSRTQEVFQTLKAIQPPNGTPQGSNNSNEKKVKVQEQLRTIRVLFKRLRLIYEKCNENCQIQGMEYTHIESLIPYKDEIDPKHDEKKNSEAYRLVCEESKEVMEQVILKNKQLKEVIDHLRRIIWEINTMLTMIRS